MRIYYSTESFIEKAKNHPKNKNKYLYDLTVYTIWDAYVSIFCIYHKKYFHTQAYAHLRGVGCPDCADEIRNSALVRCAEKKRRKAAEDFINRAKAHPRNKTKNYGYNISEYINSYTLVSVFCPTHNIYFSVSPSAHIRGRGCALCAIEEKATKRKLKAKANFEARAKVHPKHQGKNYGYWDVEYIDSITPVSVYCPAHKIYFLIRPNNHLQGKGCRFCAIDSRANARKEIGKATFITKALVLGNNCSYELSEYIDTSTPLIIICDKHGQFKQTPNSHLQGSGCPLCRESKGEKAIRKFFTENNILFDRQFSFEECKNIKVLPFDFVLFDDNNNCKALIEYQGEQHYIPIKYNKKVSDEQALANLLLNQHRDKIKQSYCTQNNIPLLIIPYTNLKNIPNLIQDFLHKY